MNKGGVICVNLNSCPLTANPMMLGFVFISKDKTSAPKRNK